MNTRASWKGSLHVSLLAVRVKAFASSTAQQDTIQLHQLHRDCLQRIRYQKICPAHGPLESDQIVMGYEHAPHQHVEIDLRELDQLRSEHELRSIRIATFVDHSQIPPLYYGERQYYLLPDGPTAQHSYALLVQAMASQAVEAVAQVVLSKREQLVLLRPIEKRLLVMTSLKYASQVRVPAPYITELGASPTLSQEELELAESLVRLQTKADFQLSDYQDPYATKLAQLVDATMQGQQLIPACVEQPAEILSLMEALQASVQQATPATTKRKPLKVNGRTRKRTPAKSA